VLPLRFGMWYAVGMPGLRDLLKEARGSAVWDGIKWLCAAGRSVVGLARAIIVFRRQKTSVTESMQPKLPVKADLVTSAPRLLIRYTSKEHGKVTFVNDGPGSIVNLELGPLKWEESRRMGILGSIGVLLPRTTCEKVMLFEASPNHGYELYHYMRESVPCDADTKVTVTYEDSKGTQFAQDFLLTTQIDGTIDWKPDVLRLRGPELAATT